MSARPILIVAEDVEGEALATLIVNQIRGGIIDPTKVVRVALENAVSVASILLLTEATMTEIDAGRKEAAGSGLDA